LIHYIYQTNDDDKACYYKQCVGYNKSEHLKKKRERFKKKNTCTTYQLPGTGKLDAMGTTKNRCKETERRRRKKRRKKDKRLKGMWRPISERENKRKRESSRNLLSPQPDPHQSRGSSRVCFTFPPFVSLVLKNTTRLVTKRREKEEIKEGVGI